MDGHIPYDNETSNSTEKYRLQLQLALNEEGVRNNSMIGQINYILCRHTQKQEFTDSDAGVKLCVLRTKQSHSFLIIYIQESFKRRYGVPSKSVLKSTATGNTVI